MATPRGLDRRRARRRAGIPGPGRARRTPEPGRARSAPARAAPCPRTTASTRAARRASARGRASAVPEPLVRREVTGPLEEAEVVQGQRDRRAATDRDRRRRRQPHQVGAAGDPLEPRPPGDRGGAVQHPRRRRDAAPRRRSARVPAAARPRAAAPRAARASAGSAASIPARYRAMPTAGPGEAASVDRDPHAGAQEAGHAVEQLVVERRRPSRGSSARAAAQRRSGRRRRPPRRSRAHRAIASIVGSAATRLGEIAGQRFGGLVLEGGRHGQHPGRRHLERDAGSDAGWASAPARRRGREAVRVLRRPTRGSSCSQSPPPRSSRRPPSHGAERVAAPVAGERAAAPARARAQGLRARTCCARHAARAMRRRAAVAACGRASSLASGARTAVIAFSNAADGRVAGRARPPRRRRGRGGGRSRAATPTRTARSGGTGRTRPRARRSCPPRT